MIVLCGIMIAASVFALRYSIDGLRAGKDGAGLGVAISAIGFAFFGFGAVASAVTLRSGSLRLDMDGFQCSGLFRTQYRWTDVSDFDVFQFRSNASVVFKTAQPSRNLWTRFITFLARGRDSHLPDSYGMSPEALAHLMTDWQRRAVGSCGGGRQSTP